MPAPKYQLACPECGERFTPGHHRQVFCTPAHSRAFNNRALARGQSIYTLAMTWRSARSARTETSKAAGRAAFSALCRALDAYAAEDTQAGRPNAVGLFRRRDALGLLD